MDFFTAVVLFIIFFIMCSLCSFCCRTKRKGIIFSSPVVVTSATHTAPGGYPTTMQTVPVYPPPGNANYQQAVYPQQAPYPMSGQPQAMPMPMPQTQTYPNPIGMNPQMMPPYPTAGPSALPPPSYESAVNTNQNMTAPMGYEKQAPYNPTYPTGSGY